MCDHIKKAALRNRYRAREEFLLLVAQCTCRMNTKGSMAGTSPAMMN
jgi:hypothetical protein